LGKGDIAEIYIRDPYIFADAVSGYYYLYRSASVGNLGGVEVFKSENLRNWIPAGNVFVAPENNWANGGVWAPEMHFYNGKYYLFATMNSDVQWQAPREGWPLYTLRGTQIFYADSPEGPFLPFDTTPHTPANYMALDGTLWVEDGIPYMIFCHEWVQVVDGTMEMTELEPDLSAPVGTPTVLFNASDAPWTPTGRTSYITDGCFLHRTQTGKLLMIWSSASSAGYAIGIAESTTGSVAGPWIHQPTLLFNKDGGHGMIFRTFGGKLCIVFHQPNSGAERAHIYELDDTGNTLVLKDEIFK
jgi:GH43 family beta-xylosidase